ncbi:MFS transporter [Streptomyces sp. NPDC052107]|uniref:MFS transporter n=1 Tax=Streptomyces sp. NPDC052107 TaxID=3155632 RepID=UPI003419A95B
MTPPANGGSTVTAQPPTPPSGTASSWAPLRIRVFRTLWLAQFVSNVGSWMQTVGAQWLITQQSGSAGQIALVQTAASLPVLILGIPAGALADIVDRRRLLLFAQVLMLSAAGLLAALTALGHMNPSGVLVLTFVLGCGTALMNPAWQAIQPDLVASRDQIPAAAALGGVNMNVARAVGPALGGLVVAVAGTATVFALNAASFLVTLAALATWHRPAATSPVAAERMLPAIRAGYRYVRHAPRVRKTLGRSLVYVPCAAALWALLPVAAHQQLGLGVGGYGLLLAAVGAGAVLGAVLLPQVRDRWSSNVTLAGGGILLAMTLVVLALVGIAWVVGVGLVFSGLAWVGVLSILNAQMQVTVPEWVRARALAVYLTIFQGGLAIGAAVWGGLADGIGLRGALLVAAAVLVIGSLAGLFFSVPDTALDRSPSMHWPAPVMVLDPSASTGPVLVTVEYRVPADHADAFTDAMEAVGRSRLRTGALRWDLFRDGSQPDTYLEVFAVASWEEHERQHSGRLTGYDRSAEEKARSLLDPEHPFKVSHYLPARRNSG